MPEGAPPSPRSGSIAIILKGYPRLSETFIAQEIRGLERRGLSLRLYSLRHPTDHATHPIHAEIEAPVVYLPEYLHDAPRRVAAAWLTVRRWPGTHAALVLWRRDLTGDPSRNRIRRFGQACVLAAELADDVTHLHAHFLHTPASVTRYAAVMRSLSWSVSAHAKDVWTLPDWEKREKIASSQFVAACSAYNADHLAALAPTPSRVHLLYHGLDLDRFPPAARIRSERTGADPRDPAIILSVGRLVAKKGYDVLLQALAALPPDLAWRFVHIGSGPCQPALARQSAAFGLTERVQWLGAQSQKTVLRCLQTADLFALASRITADGDRDGLPNVLMEAQSQGLACVATRVAAIPELITQEPRNQATGMLVAPDDPQALSEAIAQLIADPDLRARLGSAGEARVRSNFDMTTGLDRLAQLLAPGRLPSNSPDNEVKACASSSMRP